MKYLLIIVLCLITLNTQGQQTVNKKWARIGLITSSIIFNAIGDGMYDNGNKLISKSFRTASIGSLLAIPVVVGSVSKKKAFKYGLSYGLMRVGLFDITYNKTRGLPLNYTGTTSVYDRVISGVPKPMITAVRMTSIWISIELNNREVSK